VYELQIHAPFNTYKKVIAINGAQMRGALPKK